jgi:hypothetical protein
MHRRTSLHRIPSGGWAHAAVRWMRRPSLPVFLSRDLWSSDDAMRIHRSGTAAAYPQQPAVVKWLAICGAAMLWPLNVVRLSRAATAEFGPEVRSRRGISLRSQAWTQCALALTHSIPPEAYYTYALYERENYRRATRFLHDFEQPHLLRFVNTRSGTEILDDKVAFYQLAERRGLPIPTVFAVADAGQLVFSDPRADHLPSCDLFVKPARGWGGRGASLWTSQGTESYQRGFGTSTSANEASLVRREDLEASLRASSAAGGTLIVQRRLRNHSGLADLSLGAVLSARVLTAFVDGDAEFVRATMKIPLGGAVVNNYGIAAAIDFRTGVLGAASAHGPVLARYSTHPETGARIEGRCVPHWSAVVALALAAHREISQIPFIGWDIAFSETGPVLLEGNWNWGAEFLQKPHGSPLLDTRFADAYLTVTSAMRARS